MDMQEYVNGIAMALVGSGSALDTASPRLAVRLYLFMLSPHRASPMPMWHPNELCGFLGMSTQCLAFMC